MAQLLPGIEAQLAARPFLLGASASECDFSLYHVLWPVWKVPATRPLLEPYPKTMAFLDRMGAQVVGAGTSTTLMVGVRNLFDVRFSEPGYGGFDIPGIGRLVFVEVRQAF